MDRTAAAAAGAKEVTFLDASAEALRLAEHNARRNLPHTDVQTMAGDAVNAVSRVGAGMTAALAVGSAGAPALAFDTGPRIGAAPSAATSTAPARPSIGSVTVNVYAQPGESADDIARRVLAMINAPNPGSFGDEPGGFD